MMGEVLMKNQTVFDVVRLVITHSSHCRYYLRPSHSQSGWVVIMVKPIVGVDLFVFDYLIGLMHQQLGNIVVITALL